MGSRAGVLGWRLLALEFGELYILYNCILQKYIPYTLCIVYMPYIYIYIIRYLLYTMYDL